MNPTTVRILSSLLLILLELPFLIHSAPQQTSDINIDISQQSSSGSNPSCADVAFAHISCPSPGLCYYSDRSGTPACCPAGQNCQTGSETGSGSGSGSGPSDTPASASPSDSSSGGQDSSPPPATKSEGDKGSSDSSEDSGSSYNGGGSYVGPGAENVLVLMNNSAHARGMEGGSGVGRFALRMVWSWVLMLNVFGV